MSASLADVAVRAVAASTPIPASTLFEKIVVRRDPAIKEIGGIALPETSQKEQAAGTVIDVGGEVKHVRVGDRVVFAVYAGVELEKDLGLGEDLKVMREDEVLLVLR